MENLRKIKHTEEFYDVAQRMPSKYSNYIIGSLLAFVGLIFVFGFLVEVPDTLITEAKIISTNPPVVLKAQVNGKIHFLHPKLKSSFDQGEYLAVIENSANYEDVLTLKKWIQKTDIWKNFIPRELFSRNLVLGDISSSFYSFKSAYIKYQQLIGEDNTFRNAINYLEKENVGCKNLLRDKNKLLAIYQREKNIRTKHLTEDSLLAKNGSITSLEVEQSLLNSFANENHIVTINSDITQLEQTVLLNEEKISQQKSNLKQSKIEIINTLNDALNQLQVQIKNWEKLYAIIVPQKCSVELANIIPEGDFVSIGEPVYNVIYQRSHYYGITMLPSEGAGKVKNGDSVFIKLSPFPYQDYGVLKGTIKNVSQNIVEKYYLAYIDLPQDLLSDTKVHLNFAETMYGEAQIITGTRKLILKILNQLRGLTSLNRNEKLLEEDNMQKENQNEGK